MSSTNTLIFLVVAAAGGVYAYTALTSKPAMDPKYVHVFKPYDPNMKVNEINYHNDKAVNKAWWDNQHRRADRHYEDPAAKDFTDHSWY